MKKKCGLKGGRTDAPLWKRISVGRTGRRRRESEERTHTTSRKRSSKKGEIWFPVLETLWRKKKKLKEEPEKS